MEIVENAGTYAPAPDDAPSFVEQLRVAALSVGTYSIPAGGVDTQSPHREDEIYVVTAGAAVMEAGARAAPVRGDQRGLRNARVPRTALHRARRRIEPTP